MSGILVAAIFLWKAHSTPVPPICDMNLPNCESGKYPQCEFKEDYNHVNWSEDILSFWTCVKIRDSKCSGILPTPMCSAETPFLNCQVGFMGAKKWLCDSSSACTDEILKCPSDEISQCDSSRKPHVKENITGKWNCASIDSSGCSTLPFLACPKAEPVPSCSYRGWKCEWPLGWGAQPQMEA